MIRKIILLFSIPFLLFVSANFLLFPAIGVTPPVSLPCIRISWDCAQVPSSPKKPVTEEKIASPPKESPKAVLPPHPSDAMLAEMSLEEKVGQLFFARCPDTDAMKQIENYHPAGYVLFGRDFENQTKDSVRETIASYQTVSEIPLLIGVDEEGGSVVRISKYKAFRPWPFQSPQELFEEGGTEAFLYDTAEKDALLHDLGINVNLAPVCDVSTSEEDYMYRRTLGQDANATAEYVRLTVGRMKKDRMGSVLKHFPGYGSNGDTHEQKITDSRDLNTYRRQDFLPFQAGIDAGANAVLMSHLIVSSVDTMPASLSKAMHDLLRKELNFSGVILTDDLAMEAITSFAGKTDPAVLALEAGNDLILTSNLPVQHQAIMDALANGILTETQIDEHVQRVLDWKESLGLITYEEEPTLDPDLSWDLPMEKEDDIS